MDALIKRFSETADIPYLTILASTAALISVNLLFLDYRLQFLSTAVIIILEVYLLEIIDINVEENLLSTLILLIISLPIFEKFIAALFVSMLILTMLLPVHRSKLMILSVSAHFVDLFSTIMALTSLNEVNPLTKFLIDIFGKFEGLFISKMSLIILPVIWTYYNMDELESKMVYSIIYVIGLSIGLRNLILIF